MWWFILMWSAIDVVHLPLEVVGMDSWQANPIWCIHSHLSRVMERCCANELFRNVCISSACKSANFVMLSYLILVQEIPKKSINCCCSRPNWYNSIGCDQEQSLLILDICTSHHLSNIPSLSIKWLDKRCCTRVRGFLSWYKSASLLTVIH